MHDSGLVHVSHLADRYIRDPHEVVAVGDIVKVWVLAVDKERRRVSLTMVRPGSERRGARPAANRRPMAHPQIRVKASAAAAGREAAGRPDRRARRSHKPANRWRQPPGPRGRRGRQGPVGPINSTSAVRSDTARRLPSRGRSRATRAGRRSRDRAPNPSCRSPTR